MPRLEKGYTETKRDNEGFEYKWRGLFRPQSFGSPMKSHKQDFSSYPFGEVLETLFK